MKFYEGFKKENGHSTRGFIVKLEDWQEDIDYNSYCRRSLCGKVKDYGIEDEDILFVLMSGDDFGIGKTFDTGEFVLSAFDELRQGRRYSIVQEWTHISQYLLNDEGNVVINPLGFEVLSDEYTNDCPRYVVKSYPDGEVIETFDNFEDAKQYKIKLEKES